MWVEAATAVGAEFAEIDDGLFEFRRGESVTRVAGQRTPFANPVAMELASAKDLASQVLRDSGVPVPEHVVVTRDDTRAAVELLDAHGGPVVVKPARDGWGGQGVTTSIMTAAQLERAIRRAALTSHRVIVERELRGEHFRILLLDGDVLDVLRRQRPSVIGDGSATIERLMFAEYRRRLADERNWKPFPVDLDCLFTLELQGLSLASVPSPGAAVVVKGATNISGRRECSTFGGELAEDVVATVSRAAAAVGVRLAGVDLVATGVSEPFAATGGAVLEVNPVPGLFHHYNVADEDGASRVAIPILEALLADGAA